MAYGLKASSCDPSITVNDPSINNPYVYKHVIAVQMDIELLAVMGMEARVLYDGYWWVCVCGGLVVLTLGTPTPSKKNSTAPKNMLI